MPAQLLLQPLASRFPLRCRHSLLSCQPESAEAPSTLSAGKRSANVQGQVTFDTRPFDEADHLGHKIFVTALIAYEIRFGKLVLQVARQLKRVISHQYGADPARALGHENGTERALRYCKVNDGVSAAVSKARWRHPKGFVRSLIETAIRVESFAVDRIRYRRAPAKDLANALRPLSCAVATRRESRDRLERPMKVEDTHACVFGNLLKGRCFIAALDEPAHLLDLGPIGLGKGETRELARPEVGLFRSFRCRKELHILRTR